MVYLNGVIVIDGIRLTLYPDEGSCIVPWRCVLITLHVILTFLFLISYLTKLFQRLLKLKWS